MTRLATESSIYQNKKRKEKTQKIAEQPTKTTNNAATSDSHLGLVWFRTFLGWVDKIIISTMCFVGTVIGIKKIT